MRRGPSPGTRHPIAGVARTGVLKPFITRPNIVVGDYQVRWWDWDAEKITRNVRAICGSEVTALEVAT